MLEIFAPFFMTGGWVAASAAALAGSGDAMRDVNGVLITVGAHVAFIGTVLALNPRATHFDDVTVESDHPNTDAVIPDRILQFHPLELIVQ